MPYEDRSKYERRLTKLFALLLAQQLGRITDLAELDVALLGAAFWADEVALMIPGIAIALAEASNYSAQGIIQDLNIGIDEGIVHSASVEWARTYAYNLITGITETTRRIVSQAVAESLTTPGFTLQDFVDMVQPSFGPVRAEMIGVTEITRAASQGAEIAAGELRSMGIELEEIWLTNRDELVCPICSPLHNKKRGDGWTEPPPAHPRCRCTVAHRIPR